MDNNELMEREIHRLSKVLVPMKSYDSLVEEKMQVFFEKAYKDDKREMATHDISRIIGEQLGRTILDKQSNTPVIVLGIIDDVVRSQIWMFSQNHVDFRLNILSDGNLSSWLIFKAKKSGAPMLGGGISEHHTLWWNQYREGPDMQYTLRLHKNLTVV